MFFNNQVIAIGSLTNPININPVADKNWGTLAIIGPKTKGSILSYINITNDTAILHGYQRLLVKNLNIYLFSKIISVRFFYNFSFLRFNYIISNIIFFSITNR